MRYINVGKYSSTMEHMGEYGDNSRDSNNVVIYIYILQIIVIIIVV